MPALPSGTVTFLFTDIEGSTKRWEQYPAQMRAALARLLSAGHGGQVLLSNPTHDLVRDDLPQGAHTLDLGEHRLKDLIRPEHIFQLVGDGLPSEFPPLKTLDNRPNNLPRQATSLVG